METIREQVVLKKGTANGLHPLYFGLNKIRHPQTSKPIRIILPKRTPKSIRISRMTLCGYPA